MSPLTIVYIITIIISIAVAFLLVHLTRLSGKETAKDRQNRRADLPGLDAFVDSSLRETIYEEIKQVVDSKQQTQEIGNVVLDIFSKELNKRVSQGITELNKKYENLIEQKTQNEEIAWNKYKKVLTDKKQTEAVIRSIAEGLLVVDASGKVIMMNPAAEKLLGVSKKDKIGKSVVDSIKEEQLVSLVKHQEDKDNEGKEIELISQTDETKKILRASSAVIENENGQTVGMVSVLSDITKQKELDALKANFIASVSHELRTPLVAIDKSISLILSKSTGELSKNQEQFLTIAERNLKRLSLLINDLLDLSKLEAGKMEIVRQPSYIEQIIDEVVESLNTWAQTKSIQFEKTIQENLPMVAVEPNKIIQVLNNLIGNAIKFTPNDGKIIVAAAFDKEKDEVRVSVQDNGVGIEKDDLNKIFDKFYQSGERASSDINGTGIGLTIAKEIVELHGGRIWAESEKNHGAKFTFTLPLKTA